MKKPIIATNTDRFLIAHRAFVEPHKAWFDMAIKKTGDKSLEKWKGKEDYFKGVNQAMAQLMPKASQEERTKQAREWYQEYVIEYIETHPDCIYKKVIEVLKKLKTKYRIALITTNTKDHIQKILEAANISDLYDIIIASSTGKEPKKSELLLKFIDKYKEPKIYISGKNGPTIHTFNENKIPTIYTTWDEKDEEAAKLATKVIKYPIEIANLKFNSQSH